MRLALSLSAVLLFCSAILFSQTQPGSSPKPVAPEPCPASAHTVKYTFMLAGKAVGEQTTTANADGSVDYCFEFNDRGRGPRLETHTVFGPGHVPTASDTKGYDYYKGPVTEHYALAQQVATWKNKAEQAEMRLAAPAYFVGMYAPPEDLATLAAALLAAPNHTLALLPEGEARIEHMTDLKISNAGESQTVHEYGITGLGFSPSIVWLDDSNRLFAEPSSWSSVIRAGWEPVADQLLKAQESDTDRRYAELAKSLAHHPSGPLAIVHAKLFDTATATSKPNTTVVITGDRITAVGPDDNVKVPAGAEVIDARGKALLPGLWDMHVHVGDEDGMLNIANGVTTARDLGNDVEKVTTLRRNWQQGLAIGPRLILAALIDGSGPYHGPTKLLVDTPEQVRETIDRVQKLGFVQIKVYSSIKPELVPVITAYAHQHGLRVSGHVPAFMTAADCVRDGFDELQHVNFLFLNFMFDKVKDTRGPARFTSVAENAALLDLDSQPVRDFIALLKEHHTVSDPTVSIFEDMFTARPGQVSPAYAEVADRMPAQVRRGFLAGGLDVPAGMDQRYRDSFQAMLNLVKKMYDSGITIVAGTDALGGFTLHRELENYVRAGIPAPQVLQLDTLGAARVMKRDGELGSIEPGKLADVIVVDGDPATRISDIRRVQTVIKGGVRYDVTELDRALGVKPLDFSK